MTDKPQNETDLWPEDIIQIPKIQAPVAILKEQAAILGRKTNNAIKGEVEKPSKQFGQEGFAYFFLLTAPGLDYKYRLFTLQHDIDLYPLKIYISEEILKDIMIKKGQIKGQGLIRVADESELKATLRLIFNASKTRSIIASLLSLSGYDKVESAIPF